jgi:hypothetical protein
MKLHERTTIVSRAENEIRAAVATAALRFRLTPLELLRVLIGLAQQESTYALRRERHGTYDKKADEE